MPRVLKYFLITIAALCILVLAAVGIIAATFDPNDYKPLLIRIVQEKKQRTLTIPGEIRLSFFPKLGAELGKVSISEHQGSAEFASVERAKLSLALIPLLSKQLVVDRVEVDGLRATIRRSKEGRSNYDDLLSKEEAGGQQIAFDIDGIDIRNAHLIYDDRQQARRFDIAKLRLETGKLASGVPSTLKLAADIKGNRPDIDAHIAATTGFTMDLERKRYAVKGLDAELRGTLAGLTGLQLKLAGDAGIDPAAKRFDLDGIKLSASGKRAQENFDVRVEVPKLAITDTQVTGGKLNGEARLNEGPRSVIANFSVPSFEGSPAAFKVPALALDATIREDKLDAKLKLSGAFAGDIDRLLFSSPQLTLALSGKQGDTTLNGRLATPLSVNLKAQTVDLQKLVADLSLPNPAGGTMALKANGNASIKLDKQAVAAAFNGSMDQSAFNAKLGIAGFSPMAYTFDIGIDRIDLNRYQSRAAGPAKGAAPKQAPEQPMDFSALQKLQANGKLRVGALKVANLNTTNVRVDLRAANGRLELSPLAANLYGGSTNGAFTINAGKPARFAVRQNLSGIHVGPLLKDATGKDPIEGKGNVQFDVTSSGATFEQLKRGLDGSARLELRDGAIRGVNIAQAVRNAKASINTIRGKEDRQPAPGGTGSTSEKTDFSELSGSFRIANGVARNDDLVIKSPLIRIAGAGAIDLGAERLDYLARTTVVSTLQGQGGPELQALKGVTVPVRLSGPFNAIGWRIDVAGMASELAKQKLDERKGELREKAEKSLDEQKAKVRDQLKEQLKGLLGR